MFYQKLAVMSFRHPKAILLVWAMLLGFFGVFAPKLPSVLKDHGLMPQGAYGKVEQLLASDFHIPRDPVILVFEKKDRVSPEFFRQFIRQALQPLQTIGGLDEIVSPLDRQDMLQGNAAYALLGFKQPSHERETALAAIHKRLPHHPDISVAVTGKSAVQADVNRASRQDLGKAERIGIPAAFLVLWLAFGGIVPAAIPLLVGVTGVAAAMGMMYGIGTRLELSNFVLNVIPMVGLALSIDFALMIVSRFQEELRKGNTEQALAATLRTAGRAVVFSALSVFLGLSGVLFIPLPMFSSIAIGAMTVLTVSVLLALTLVPALLALLGPAVQTKRRLQSPAAKRKNVWRGLAVRTKHSPPPSFSKRMDVWHGMAVLVMKRPVRFGLSASLLLLVCFLPLGSMKLAIPDAASLPQSYPSRIAFEAYQSHFADPAKSVIYIVAQGKDGGLTKEEWESAYALAQKLESDPQVLQAESVFSSFRLPPEQLSFLLQKPAARKKYEPVLQRFVKENKLLLRVTLAGEPSSPAVRNWLRQWELAGESAALPFWLGGEAKYRQEVFDAIFQNIKYALLFILASNYLVLFAAFRSVLIPLKTIVMNLLSLGASFGILAWIFEQGRFGMEPSDIAIMIPVFIFGLVFGISMDYGVFLVSRIYEAYRQTKDNSHAVLTGLASIGKVINSAAAIMIAVSLPFAFGEVAGVRQLGVGIAAAIFIDATIVRLILVPSLMKMLGRWNWWAPGWLKQRN